MTPPEVSDQVAIDTEVATLRAKEYDLRQEAGVLRSNAFVSASGNGKGEGGGHSRLVEVERRLLEVSHARVDAESKSKSGIVMEPEPTHTLGMQTTGLDVSVWLRMAHIPSAIVHLLDPETHPLATIHVRRAAKDKTRRVRVTLSVEGYSAPAIESLELSTGHSVEVRLLPTFDRAALQTVTELTRASVETLVEDLDSVRVEVHKTFPVWLLARNTAPLSVRDPAGGTRLDLTRYLGAFVTPNASSVMDFLRTVARRHPEHRLVGYQGSPENVEPQVRALYEALGADADVTYVNSVIAFDPEEGSASQRARLPRETLASGSANCLDGTLLYASLLEAMSLRPAIVILPGHALVAWETWPDSDEWHYLETTKTGSGSFEAARELGESLVAHYQIGEQVEPALCRRHAIRDLRVLEGITPME